MFFWFANDTFSIIDALLKLILVITGSALIICFCHRLTNFKKSRRYKYDFVRQQTQLGDLAGPTGQFRTTTAAQQRWLDAHGNLTPAAYAAYDPYNNPRAFGAANGPAYFNGLAGHPLQLPLVGFNQPSSAIAAYQTGLAALSLAQQQQQAELRNGAAGGQQAQLYEAQVQPDGSGFQARQLEADDSACPSYEEAVREAGQQAEQQVFGEGDADTSQPAGDTSDAGGDFGGGGGGFDC